MKKAEKEEEERKLCESTAAPQREKRVKLFLLPPLSPAFPRSCAKKERERES